MKKVLAILLVLAMIFAFAACGNTEEETTVEEKTTIIMGTSADYPPYEFMYPDEKGNMQYGGIDISVGQYIADYMGLELQIENMDFAYLLTAMNKGDFDMVLACVEETPERLKAADFSDPYLYELPEMILVNKKDLDQYTDLETSFNGKMVGAQSGTTKVQKAKDYCVGCTVVELGSVNDLVNELVNGKIDAIFLDGAVAENYAQTNDDVAVCSASDVFSEQEYYLQVAVAKGDPKNLLPEINAAIAKMTSEGKIEEYQALADSLSGVAQAVTVAAPEGYEKD